MAIGPIDYSSMQVDPFQGLGTYLAIGQQIRDAYGKREAEQKAAALEQQYAADVQAAMQDPSASKFSELALKYPKHREAYKQAWDTLSAERQQSELRDMGELTAALSSGRPDIALSKIDTRINAMKQSGADTKALEMLRSQVEADPKAALGSTLRIVSGLGEPGKKLLDNLSALGTEQRAADKAPAELAKVQADADAAQSDAQTKRITAKYADSNAVLDLQKKGWDLKAIEADIDFKKQSTRIAAMNAAIARETNDLKRQELQLKVDDAIAARDTKLREKVATAEAGASSIDNMLNTIERVKANKSLDAVVGSMQGSRLYPNAAVGTLTPGMNGDEQADAIALIDTLGSQAFLAQIPSIKGMGALSNAEGEKLQSALQNLSRQQSEKQFRANLDEAARLLKKGRESLSKSTGVPLGQPDTPAAPGARPPLSSFQR